MPDNSLPIDGILEELRGKCGDSEFGYRMQALFAHTVMRLGWSILAINAKGHPDILAQTYDDEVLIQVKSNAHRSANSIVELSGEDIGGIKAIGNRTGWFALLDCAAPVQWIMIKSDRAAALLGRPMYLATLQANCDLATSETCTKHFCQMISENRVRLPALSFRVLRDRAFMQRGL